MMIIFWVVATTFIIKILGNLALAYGTLSLKEGEEGSSVLLPIIFDIIFLILLTGLGWMLGEHSFPYGGLSVFTWSLVAVMFSYVHYFVVLVFGSFLSKN